MVVWKHKPNTPLIFVGFISIFIFHLSIVKEVTRDEVFKKLRGCLVCDFKQSFSVFKQYFTHFNTLFHPHVFLQMFLNNNFQFLNTYIKRAICFVFSLFGRLERNNPNYKLVKMVNNDQRETRLRNLLPKIFPFIIGLKKGKPSSSVLIRLQY